MKLGRQEQTISVANEKWHFFVLKTKIDSNLC